MTRSKSGRRRTRARTSLAVLAVAAVGAAPADDTLARARAALQLPRTAEGMQARYDAGRALEIELYGNRRDCASKLALAQGLVRWAEGYDRSAATDEAAGRRQAVAAAREGCRLARLASRKPLLRNVPPLVRAAPTRSTDAALDARLEALGRSFDGYAAVWVHDLLTGESAGWNSDARFPAASTVKLGVLLAALQRLAHPERSPLDYELRAMTTWSSNLATNALVQKYGAAAAERALRRAGATRSTFPQGYRVGTARADVERQPPLVSGRVTTARDLGRVLYVLHGCALGNVPALRAAGISAARCAYALRLLLSSDLRGNNVGLLRPFLRLATPVAQKNGWLRDARHTAAIVYFRGDPKIIVVLTYAPKLSLVRARELGRQVLAAVR